MPLAPPNLRIIQNPPEGTAGDDDNDFTVEDAEEHETKKYDDKGNVIEIELPDGSIKISLDGSPLEGSGEKSSKDWFDNLVSDINEDTLSSIAQDLLRDIEEDITSRKDWIDDRAAGIKLLGLRVDPPTSGASDSAPVEGMSRVRHPLLQEAVLRFQANARSELLPTDGPIKIREDNNNADINSDELANDLENDLNHYLTSTSTEYYPDTDRMLLMLGFGGSAFKKIYFCPIRRRPVSESVDADFLIVNNNITDLQNARRVTHRVMMRPSVLKRMQLLGVYSNIELGSPKQPTLDALQREKAAQQGVKPDVTRTEDNDYEVYECDCELDLQGFKHTQDGKETGLEIPYRVTIEKGSQKILSIVRNYDEDTKDLPVAKQRYVKYTFIPGFGFYDIGLLHILGNTTTAITAAWREMLDAGMFASFPGFLISDAAGRQNTTIFRVPPGGGAQVKTGGMPINQAVMPLPYKDPSQALMSLVENMAQTGQRVGGTAEQAVGEGKQDAPVGTTLALIDQATKVMNSVHKRLHNAQALEFQLLVQCFRENPESFWQNNKKPARQWDEQTFLRALDQYDLVPQADPNTASQTQRIMKIIALKQIQASNPALYDPISIDKVALRAIGWSNPEQFMVPDSSIGAPTPEQQKEIAELQIKKQDSDSKDALNNAKIQEISSNIHKTLKGGLAPQHDPVELAKLNLQHQSNKLKDKAMNLQQERSAVDDQNRDRDRASDLHLASMRLEGGLAHDSLQANIDHFHNENDRRHELNMQSKDQSHNQTQQMRDQLHEHMLHAQELIDEADKPEPHKPTKKGKKK